MGAKPKILMIDDAKAMHAAVRARLNADGMEFFSAFDGPEGICAAAQLQPDVILLDVEMPDPNGFEVCRQLKANMEICNIPVIFLSGITSTQEKVRGLNLGAIDYVTKPFDAAELLARVRASLRNKELLDLLSKKAMIDGMTGLYNRGYLNQRLGEEIANCKRRGRMLSCILLDVDHFKSINDTHGHGFGDVVLKGVADLLQTLSRAEDIPCRYGGEEFVVLARESNINSAMCFAERLRAGIENTTFSRGIVSAEVTCSFGISDSVHSLETLLEHADQALYHSKRDGRNRCTAYQPSAVSAA